MFHRIKVPTSLSHLEVGPVILGDERRVTLRKHHDLLLDVLDFVLCLLQVNDLDGHHLLIAVVHALVDLSEGAFADPLLLREHELWVNALENKKRNDSQKLKDRITVLEQQHLCVCKHIWLTESLTHDAETQRKISRAKQ